MRTRHKSVTTELRLLFLLHTSVVRACSAITRATLTKFRTDAFMIGLSAWTSYTSILLAVF